MEFVRVGGMRVQQPVRRMRRRGVCRVRRGHVVWRGHSLERVLRLFGCVSVLAVLVLVLWMLVVVRRGRRGLDRRHVVWVVADVRLLASEPLADHRLTRYTVCSVLVVR